MGRQGRRAPRRRVAVPGHPREARPQVRRRRRRGPRRLDARAPVRGEPRGAVRDGPIRRRGVADRPQVRARQEGRLRRLRLRRVGPRHVRRGARALRRALRRRDQEGRERLRGRRRREADPARGAPHAQLEPPLRARALRHRRAVALRGLRGPLHRDAALDDGPLARDLLEDGPQLRPAALPLLPDALRRPLHQLGGRHPPRPQAREPARRREDVRLEGLRLRPEPLPEPRGRGAHGRLHRGAGRRRRREQLHGVRRHAVVPRAGGRARRGTSTRSKSIRPILGNMLCSHRVLDEHGGEFASKRSSRVDDSRSAESVRVETRIRA